MKALFNRMFLQHNVDSDAEGAYRIKDFQNYADMEFDGEPYITLVHPEHYRDLIKESCFNNEYIAEIFLTPDSYRAACLAVGLTILASEQNDFAVVRPPGHHAGKISSEGFCLFNNIAIATQKLVNEGKKVFILDIDGHHGNGTQSIFYESNRVFFCSIHQQYAYPYSGFPIEIGKDAGMGYTLNFPLLPGSGDKELLACVDKAIKKARDFNPDVVGVSAGFDGYEHDRLLSLKYTQKGFYECGHRLRHTFRNVFAVLEGGYHLEMKACIDSFIEGVNIGGKPSIITWDQDLSIG